jgi:signal transduction histidine kinase
MMLLAHFTWLAVVCLLGAWWGRLLMKQAARIVELEASQGMARDVAEGGWLRTQRMIFWESSTFFTLLFASSTLLLWIYWRDVKRARGLHAFFASVTHELRTPLTSIRLQAESIADNQSDEDPQNPLIQRLLEDTIRLEAQVERTLELARVEGGGPVYTQPLQVKPWLDRFLKLWTHDYKGRVQFNSAEVDDLVIEADPVALQVIFKNVLENSIRHSKRTEVFVSIRGLSSANQVSLIIHDNGDGYSGNIQALGNIFQKGASSQGTGVGLYLVKTLMKRMGGRLRFSVPELCTTTHNGFQISLDFREGRLSG